MSSQLNWFNTNARKNAQLAYKNHIFWKNKEYKTKSIFYTCDKKLSSKCTGSVTVSPKKTTVLKEKAHQCGGYSDQEINVSYNF